MTRMRIKRAIGRLPAHLGTGLVVGLALAAATPAFAEAADEVPEPRGATDQTALATDIVVTARFREERLEDTPIAISAVNADTLEQSVVTDITGMQKFLPNVQFGRIAFAGNSLSASIRGISFADLEKTFDPAVGVAIDGVFLGTNTGAALDFSDIEMVEVLRGPQGTLFGRNTVGGVISIRRTRPTGELGGRFHARYASYNMLDMDAVVNLPKIGDALSLKMFGQRKTSDLFVRDRATGKRLKGRDYYALGTTAQIDVSSDTTILGTLEYFKDRSEYAPSVNMSKPTGLPFGMGGSICDLTLMAGLGQLGCDTVSFLRQEPERFRFADVSIPFKSYIDGWMGTLEINTKLGGFDLTSVTGYRDSHDSLLIENTGAPPIPVAPGVAIPMIVAARDQYYNQFSQELRIHGDLTDAIDLVAGVYYLHTDYKIGPYPYNGAAAGTFYIFNSPVQNISSAQKLDSFAVFAESIVKLGDKVRLTAGGRYTIETKKFSTEFKLPVVAAFSAALKETWRDPSWRVILDWRPNDDLMLYTSWSRGVRSGGFNGRGTTPTSLGPYDPERVDSYELGFKSQLVDNKIMFNAAVFQADYKNKQEEIIRAAPSGFGTETVVQNASSARIRGIEVELMARPTPELTLRASGAHLDAKYKSFLLPDLTTPGNPLIDVAAGRNFRRAPRYTFNAGMDYVQDIGGGNSISLTIDYAYTGDAFVAATVDPAGAGRDVSPAYGTVDASIAFIHAGDKLKNLRIAAYGRDLFHKDGGRLGAAIDTGIFYFGALTQTREFGVEASIKF